MYNVKTCYFREPYPPLPICVRHCHTLLAWFSTVRFSYLLQVEEANGIFLPSMFLLQRVLSQMKLKPHLCIIFISQRHRPYVCRHHLQPRRPQSQVCGSPAAPFRSCLPQIQPLLRCLLTKYCSACAREHPKPTLLVILSPTYHLKKSWHRLLNSKEI